jgi:hypothetical protein
MPQEPEALQSATKFFSSCHIPPHKHANTQANDKTDVSAEYHACPRGEKRKDMVRKRAKRHQKTHEYLSFMGKKG